MCEFAARRIIERHSAHSSITRIRVSGVRAGGVTRNFRWKVICAWHYVKTRYSNCFRRDIHACFNFDLARIEIHSPIFCGQFDAAFSFAISSARFCFSAERLSPPVLLASCILVLWNFASLIGLGSVKPDRLFTLELLEGVKMTGNFLEKLLKSVTPTFVVLVNVEWNWKKRKHFSLYVTRFFFSKTCHFDNSDRNRSLIIGSFSALTVFESLSTCASYKNSRNIEILSTRGDETLWLFHTHIHFNQTYLSNNTQAWESITRKVAQVWEFSWKLEAQMTRTHLKS